MIEFLEFRSQELKTCKKKIKNKSYHHRPIFRPILEDGNVNKVSFEMIFKRSESLCLVLKPLKHEQNVYLILFSMYQPFACSIVSIFVLIREPFANSCTTRLITKSYEIPVDPDYPTLQNNRNKIYRIAERFRKTFITFPND